MKLLKLSPYYDPEQIASTHLSKDIERACVEAGWTIEIYCPSPTRGITEDVRAKYKHIKYEEFENGKIIVHRFTMFREGRNPLFRALRYVLVNAIQYFKAIRADDVNVIFSSSTPPTQGVLCALVKKKLSKRQKKSIPYVYNLQDVFPDSLVTTGLTKKGSFIWKIGRKIEDYTYKNADHIIVISESMKRNIMEKGVKEEKISVVSNWIDVEATMPISKDQNRLYEEFGISKEKFTVLYAGNFGAAQGADVVLRTAELLKDDPRIQFVIFGGGALYEDARRLADTMGLKNIVMNSLLPQERVPEVYSLGDVALITCKKGVGNSGMPSKTWSIMACNTPIIAAFDTDSELADVLKAANAGVCVEPENPETLKDAILGVIEKNRTYYGGGRAYACANASKAVCVSRYIDILKDVVK